MRTNHKAERSRATRPARWWSIAVAAALTSGCAAHHDEIQANLSTAEMIARIKAEAIKPVDPSEPAPFRWNLLTDSVDKPSDDEAKPLELRPTTLAVSRPAVPKPSSFAGVPLNGQPTTGRSGAALNLAEADQLLARSLTSDQAKPSDSLTAPATPEQPNSSAMAARSSADRNPPLVPAIKPATLAGVDLSTKPSSTTGVVGPLEQPKTDGSMNRTAGGSPLPAEIATAPTSATPSIPASVTTYPIDLPTALRLAESVNPVIGEARVRIDTALAQRMQARSLLLPNLNIGTNYHAHTGVFQRSSGQILSVNSQSLYFGGGGDTVAQGTLNIPAVSLLTRMSDALFEPLAARQQVDLVKLDAAATANAVLLEVANQYQELVAATAMLEARRATESEAAEVFRVAAAYSRTGEGRPADANRAQTELNLIRGTVREAEENVAVAAARLSRRLHLDPSTRIVPASSPFDMVNLIDPATDLEQLISVAIKQRPEIGARTVGVAEAETRVRQEIARPLLPTVWIGFSGGGFGGGSNLVPPTVGNFRGRTDFDAIAYWTLRNFGLGDLNAQKRRRNQVGVAASERSRAINVVREDVATARADALSFREQFSAALAELNAARDGFRLDLQRIRETVASPLEVLDNLKQLNRARETLVTTIMGSNQAQYRLFVAMGSPPPLDVPVAPTPGLIPEEVVASVAPPASASPAEPKPAAKPEVILAQTSPSPRPEPLVVPPSGPMEPIANVDPSNRPLSEALAAMSRANQEAMRASLAQETLQQTMLTELATSTGPEERARLQANLTALANSHRDLMTARLDYDRAFWQAVSALGGVTANTPRDPGTIQVSEPPRP